MSEEQIKNMILKQCLELTTNNDFRPPISAYDGVDIDDVVRTCKQLQDKKTYLDLVKENQELKKQLENCYCNRTDCSGRIKDSKQYDSLVQRVENQQKEFIKFLEDNYKETHDIWYIKILQKYKDIIGDDK